MSAVQVFFAASGATIVDRVGRRPMLIIVNIVCCFCWIGVIVPSSIANITDTKSEEQINSVAPPVSRAVLAWVYIFQVCYSFGWTPMQALYPVEVLSFEMRAKGMAFSSLFTQIGMKSPSLLLGCAYVLTGNLNRSFGQPVRYPGSACPDPLEDICCVLRLVYGASRSVLLLHPGDQGPHCTYSPVSHS